jgi:hypothetical protein
MSISLKFFEPAYTTFLGIPRLPGRVQTFIHSCYSTALARGDVLMSLEKYFIRPDPTLSATDGLWEELISFLSEKQMLENLLHVYTVLNRFEDASYIGIMLFNQEVVAVKRISRLLHIRYGFSEGIHFRKHPEEQINPPFKPRASKSTGEIERMIGLTDVMHLIVDFYHEHSILSAPSITCSTRRRPPDLGHRSHSAPELPSVRRIDQGHACRS